MNKNKRMNTTKESNRATPVAFNSPRALRLNELVRAANISLVMAQRGEVILLAGQGTWRKLGRRIRRGETPVALLTLARKPIFARDGACTGVRLIFATRYVFDATQTCGPELPSLPTCERKEQFADEHGLELEYVGGAVTIVADYEP